MNVVLELDSSDHDFGALSHEFCYPESGDYQPGHTQWLRNVALTQLVMCHVLVDPDDPQRRLRQPLPEVLDAVLEVWQAGPPRTTRVTFIFNSSPINADQFEYRGVRIAAAWLDEGHNSAVALWDTSGLERPWPGVRGHVVI